MFSPDHLALSGFGRYGLGNSNGMPICQLEFTGIRVFCCTVSRCRGTGIATFSGNARINHCAGGMYPNGSWKPSRQGVNEPFHASSSTSGRRNRGGNQRDEKSSGGHFDIGGDRNRLGYPTTDISRKRGFGQKQNFTLDPLAGKKVQKRVNFRRRPIAPA